MSTHALQAGVFNFPSELAWRFGRFKQFHLAIPDRGQLMESAVQILLELLPHRPELHLRCEAQGIPAQQAAAPRQPRGATRQKALRTNSLLGTFIGPAFHGHCTITGVNAFWGGDDVLWLSWWYAL